MTSMPVRFGDAHMWLIIRATRWRGDDHSRRWKYWLHARVRADVQGYRYGYSHGIEHVFSSRLVER